MQGYQYKYGDKPLEGYTIHRGVGRGGFGEVYYAVSDSGREVALKVVQGYEQIELRGIRQCMNLKSPHLVTIFDVRYNKDGKPFVIMEYVAGPSLRDLVRESPAGLGEQKAAFFLREIAKGLTYLHDRGIVHRDLKPGNIFYEDGYVSIGDYGLSKAMSASQHSGQTITVGTVHYMAPEIGQGRYDHRVDIYALGIVLYEMLAGTVPYLGGSPGEVLMRHLSGEPDVSNVPEPFASVIRRAMAKDPEERYQSVQEMVEDVFGAEHIRESVSHFRVDDLSAVAERIAHKAAVGAGGRGASGSSAEPTVSLPHDPPPAHGGSSVYREGEDWWDEFGKRMDEFGERVGRWRSRFGREFGHKMGHLGAKFGEEFADHMKAKHREWRAEEHGIKRARKLDPLSRKQRVVLGLLAGGLMAVGIGFVAPLDHGFGVIAGFTAFWLMFGAVWGVGIARFGLKVDSESGFIRRLAYGGMACLLALLLCAPTLTIADLTNAEGGVPLNIATVLGAVAIAMILVNWEKRSSLGREERVSFGSTLAAGLVGLVVALIFNGDVGFTVGVLAGASLWVQVSFPWDPKRARDWQRHVDEMKAFWHQRRPTTNEHGPGAVGNGEQHQAQEEPSPAPPPPAAPVDAQADPHPARHQVFRAQLHARRTIPRGWVVPAWLRALSLLGFIGLLAAGIALLLWGSLTRGDDEMAVGITAGVGSLLLAFYCLGKTVHGRVVSWWSGLVKPLMLIGCVITVLGASLALGRMRLHGDEELIAIFLIIFSGIMFLVVAALPNAAMHSLFGEPFQKLDVSPHQVSTRRRMWALLLACIGFLGLGGLHRFYAGKIGTGLIWMFTGGLAYVGTVYDIIMISLGRFRDRHGLPLIVWQSEDELRSGPVGMANPSFAPQDSPAEAGPQGDAPPRAASDQAHDGYAHRAAPPAEAPARPLSPELGSSWHRLRSFDAVGLIMSAIGGILLLVALLTALATAIDVPWIIQAGLPDPSLAQHLAKEFDYARWPSLARKVLNGVALTTGVLGTGCFMIARRRDGVVHFVRAVFGCVGMFIALHPTLSEALSAVRWDRVAVVINADKVAMGIEMLLDGTDVGLAGAAGAIFVISLVTLAWPAPRQPIDAAREPES